MSAYLDAIASYLEAQSVAGGSTGWPINKFRSAVHGKVVVLQQTGGPPPEQASDRRWENPTFQILIQGDPLAAEATSDKAEEIMRALDRASTVSGFVDVFAQQSGPLSLGLNERQEPRFAVNVRGLQA